MSSCHRVGLVLAMWTVCVLFSAAQSGTAWGQEKEKGDAAAPAAGAPAATPKAEPSFIWWVIETSGAIGAVLLALSIYFIATVARLFVELRPQVTMPPRVIEETKSLLEKRDFKGIYNVVKADDSFYSNVVSAGMTELSSGLPEARDAMERVGEVRVVEMEKKISMLAVLGTLGPMIGLLGTLKGMIASFSVIAMSDTQIKASAVAGGISEALLLTFEGVALSVPAIYFFAVFRNRVSALTAAAMLEADEFMRRLAAAAKSKPAAAPAQPAPAAAPAPAKV